MAEVISFLKSEGEKPSAFNQRIKAQCLEAPVTKIDMAVVDGQPMVIMHVDLCEASEEDVQEGRAEQVGDALVLAPPLCAAVTVVSALRTEESDMAEVSEKRTDKLFEMGGADVVQVQVQSAEHFAWQEHPQTHDPIYLPMKVTYVMAVWEMDDAEIGSSSEDEQEDSDQAEEPEEVGEDLDEEAPASSGAEQTPKKKASKKKASKKKDPQDV